MAGSTYETFDTVAYTGRRDRMYEMVRRMWKPMVAMGVMIVFAALVIGAANASANVSPHFSQAKEVRDAAQPGSELLGQLGRSEAIKAWLPGFKFLGMGFLLAGITMVVATIIGNLKEAGRRVQTAVGASETLELRKPLTGKVFPHFMTFGLMVLVGTLIVGTYLATQVGDYYSVAKITRETTQPYLAQFGEIQSIRAWVEPLKFVGLTSLLTGIGLALATIVRVLRFQTWRVEDLAVTTGGTTPLRRGA